MSLFWMALSIFSNTLDQFMLLYLVEHQLPDARPTLKRRAAALVVFVGALSILQLIEADMAIIISFMFLLHLCYCWYFRPGEPLARIAWPLIGSFVFAGLNFFVGFLFSQVFGFDMSAMLEPTPYRLIPLTTYMVLSVTTFVLLSRVRLRSGGVPLQYRAISLCTVVLCIAFSGLLASAAPVALDQEGAWAVIVAITGFMAMSVAWLIIMNSFAAQYSANLALQAELLRGESEKIQMENLQSMYSRLRDIRHDFDKQMLGLGGYIADRDWEGLEGYFASMQAEINRDNHQTLTGLPQLDMLLSLKLQAASDMGVTTSYKFAAPSVLIIDPVDLCSIVGNLLDNAFEAQDNVPPGSRYINITFALMLDQWCIQVENSCDGIYKQEGRHFLSLKEGAGRGIGLRRVATLVSKYRGDYFIYPEKHRFRIEVFLPLNG